MSKLVTIFGGSGFLGRYVAQRMAKAGWRVRVAVRNANEAIYVRPYGAVGQVEPVFCNVRDDDSVAAVLNGADVAVNCVGVLADTGRNTFDAVQAEAPGRIARLCAGHGVGQLVHISAIGADVDAESEYFKTKAQGEAAVLEHMADALILRPSIMFGPEDQFFNRFAGLSRFGPVLPVVGGGTLFQPVYVDDVAEAVEKGVINPTLAGVFELGGPDVDSFRGHMEMMLGIINRRRLILNIPFFVARPMASIFGLVQAVSLGIVKAPINSDQVKNLAVDNIVSDDAKGLADLGVRPTAMEAVLPDYLWRFRPSGQYAAIKDSAKNLRNT